MAAAKLYSSPPAASPAPDAGFAVADSRIAVFRLLLPHSFPKADTIRLYAAVNQLCPRTAALQVYVEPLDPASAGGRVVAAVVGPNSPVRRVEASSSSAGWLALSPAQQALLAVIDTGALYFAAGEEELCGKDPPDYIRCIILVNADRLEASAGRGVMERIALEAGANLRVAVSEEGAPPPQGQPPEEVVEITGKRKAVRKALVALSSCLQIDLSVGVEEGSVFPREFSEVSGPNMGISCSETSTFTELAEGNVRTHYHEVNTRAIASKTLQQVSFRLLLPIYLAGDLIGKNALIIKGVEDETGACIDVGACIDGCKERVITICALESLDLGSHIMQTALLCIIDKMMELESNIHSTFEKAPQFLAKALVLKNHVDCLGGSIIKEMVNATGARIQILDDNDVPACAFNFERVLQISGDKTAVRKGLIALSSCLHCDPVNNSTNYVKEEGSILPWASPSPPAKRRRERGRSVPPGGSPLRLTAGHKRGSSSPPSRHRIGRVNTPMSIFWDLENCKVPSDAKVEEIAENIRNAVSMDPFVDCTAPIQAYGKAPASIIHALKASGVRHTAVIKSKKDAADKLIWLDMFRFAMDNPAPACIFLISGDADFTPAIRLLEQRGYNIMVALPDEGTSSAEFLTVGTHLWDWPSLARGQGIVSRRPGPIDTETLKSEMIQLYIDKGGFIEIGQIQSQYTEMFQKQIKLSEYKVSKMVDLFKLIGSPFVVWDKTTIVLGSQSSQPSMNASSKVPATLLGESASAPREEENMHEGDVFFEEPETPLNHALDVNPGIGHWDAKHGWAGDATLSVSRNKWDETPTPGRMADADATLAASGATPGSTPGGVAPTPGKKQRSRWDEMPASMGSATPGGIDAYTSGLIP